MQVITTQLKSVCSVIHLTPRIPLHQCRLWNKSLVNKTTAYQTYDQLGTSSLDGAVASVGSVSLACLSCHDGAQAMDSMINEPGSGLATITNVNTSMTGAPVPMLGTDLRNDHPVGIQYCGGGYTQTASAGTAANTCTDKDFFDATAVSINSTPIWYVETNRTGIQTASGANNSRDKYDMQLYTRNPSSSGDIGVNYTGSTSNTAEPFVECASCHDPHQDATGTFLRINNAGSAVCLACHTK